ncbi:MAG: YceD family protein [Hyphomicrobiales bacterium]
MRRDNCPFRRPILVADLPRIGLDVIVTASPEECVAIAREFKLPAIEALSGAYHVAATPKGARVKGEVVARVRQTCVVSLEPFEAELREPVDLAFARPQDGGGAHSGDRAISISPEDEDPPEPLLDGTVDLGAVTLEFLALGLDPYPRKPGAELPAAKQGAEQSPSPFAALAGRTRKPTGKK